MLLANAIVFRKELYDGSSTVQQLQLYHACMYMYIHMYMYISHRDTGISTFHMLQLHLQHQTDFASRLMHYSHLAVDGIIFFLDVNVIINFASIIVLISQKLQTENNNHTH